MKYDGRVLFVREVKVEFRSRSGCVLVVTCMLDIPEASFNGEELLLNTRLNQRNLHGLGKHLSACKALIWLSSILSHKYIHSIKHNLNNFKLSSAIALIKNLPRKTSITFQDFCKQKERKNRLPRIGRM